MEWLNESKLFDMARKGKRLTHVAAVVPLAILFALFSQFGALPAFWAAGALYGVENALTLEGVPATQAGFWMGAQLVLGFALIYFFLWLWLKLFEKRPFWTLGYELQSAGKRYARGFFFGLCMFLAAVGLLALFSSAAFEEGDPTKQGLAALGGVALVLFGWIAQGGAEEALLRGWVLPVVGARYKPWIGLLVSALLFSFLHGLNPGLSVIALVNLFLFGIFAGLYAMREGSLWGISALHSVWNWAQGNFFGFQVSGMEAGGGTLLNLKETGADWLTGGAFGPEGGLAVTLVLLAGIAVLLFGKGKAEAELV